MTDGYLSDASNNITIFTSGSEYSSSDENLSEESDCDEEYTTSQTFINNSNGNNEEIIERPKFQYINHINYKTGQFLKPNIKYMDNYATRCSKFDLIGIIAKRAEMLSRGAFPLVKISVDENHQDTEIDITLKEIESGLCPYVVKHNQFLLKLKDFEKKGYLYHINNIETILKK